MTVCTWQISVTLGIVLAAAALASSVRAHPGGLAEGCHNNRKTGEYRCHRGAGAPSRAKLPVMPRVGPRPVGVRPFRSCSDAHAAGVGNIRADDPRYARRLDRDNDGIACEW